MACITLLSDFGLQDASVAIARGILLQSIPEAVITDISHEVKPFYTAQAAYLLAAAYKNFPPGACHLILFDLFSKKPSRIIVTEHSGQLLISADSGVVPLATGPGMLTSWLYSELAPAQTYLDWLRSAARAIQSLRSQKIEALALPPYNLAGSPGWPQLSQGRSVECEVVHIDQYENVITAFTKEEFEKIKQPASIRVTFAGSEEIDAISATYSDVREGYKLCRFNSAGHLEICVNRGKAASLFGLRLGSKQNNIKIFFE